MTYLGFEVIPILGYGNPTEGAGPATKLFGPKTFVAEFWMYYWGTNAAPLVQSGNRLMISTIRTHLIDEQFFKFQYRDLIEGFLEEIDRNYRIYAFPRGDVNSPERWDHLNIFGPSMQSMAPEEEKKRKKSLYGTGLMEILDGDTRGEKPRKAT